MSKSKIFLIAIFVVSVAAAALVLVFKTSVPEKKAALPLKNLNETVQASPQEVPQTNPFEEVKTNPFKDVKTNPFDI